MVYVNFFKFILPRSFYYKFISFATTHPLSPQMIALSNSILFNFLLPHFVCCMTTIKSSISHIPIILYTINTIWNNKRSPLSLFLLASFPISPPKTSGRGSYTNRPHTPSRTNASSRCWASLHTRKSLRLAFFRKWCRFWLTSLGISRRWTLSTSSTGNKYTLSLNLKIWSKDSPTASYNKSLIILSFWG